MLDDLPDVPPALVLLFQELAVSKSFEQMRRRVKDMLPDLRTQSEVFLNDHITRETDSEKRVTGFEVHLDGAMDLLSDVGCQDFNCREAAAKRIARSFGLIADRVWLTDLLSEKFINFGRPTNTKLDEVIKDVLVLSNLLPLISAGIVRFRSPLISSCSDCLGYFEDRIQESVEKLLDIFLSEFQLEQDPNGDYYLKTGKCLEPSGGISIRRSKLIPQVEELAKKIIHRDVESALWKAREATWTGGAVISNSRIGMAGLLQQEGRLVDINTLLLLDDQRSFSVPWVSELDASQILQLRQEASDALPLFREMMYRAMIANDCETMSARKPSNLIADLREQAAEVRGELEAKRKYSASYWKTTYGILGLGLSAYGVATDQVMPGVAGLLPILQLLINHKTGHESEVSKLARRPGFVLVKAQDILAHSDDY